MAKNKLQKFDDMATFGHVFQPTFEALRGGGFALRGRWGDDFFHNDHPIVVELGCGRGEYTVGLAARDATRNYIGVDIKGARMWTGATESLRRGMTNVAFLRTHIEWLTELFAPGEVSEIWLTFPDPQMKKVNKRLTSTRFMARYAQVLRPGGTLHLKSDSQFLIAYTEAMARENGLAIVGRVYDLHGETPPPDGVARGEAGSNVAADVPLLRDLRTAYEAQWMARGIAIQYLALRVEPHDEWREPEVEIPLDSYRSFGRDKRSRLEAHR